MLVKINESHIQNATAQHPNNCSIGLSIRETYPNTTPYILPSSICIYTEESLQDKVFRSSKEITEWIIRHDNNKDVPEILIELDQSTMKAEIVETYPKLSKVKPIYQPKEIE